VIARPLVLLAAAVAVAAVGIAIDRGDGGGASAAPALDGAQVFRAKGCSECHNGPGWASPIGLGPDLGSAPAWAGGRIAGTSAEDYVRQSVAAPQAFISPLARDTPFQMPTITVSAEELDALVAYLLARG
jgi:cytochrome c5